MSYRITWHGPEISGATVIIGIFDGVHRGHQKLIDRAREFVSPIVALTFDPHPASIVAPDSLPTELLPLSQRINLLHSYGVDSVAVVEFTSEFSKLTPGEFINLILVNELKAAAIVVGSNFKFGSKAAGNAATLSSDRRFKVLAVDLEKEIGAPVSSTRIRDAITGGNIEVARDLLSRPHQLFGPVVHGEKRGRAIGYPTANIEVSQRATIPSDGVYAGWLSVDSNRWPAAISIGTNPTFAGDRGRQIEAYALDQRDLDLYDKIAKVEFGWRLRDTIKFTGLEPLLAQMKVDCDKARELTRDYA